MTNQDQQSSATRPIYRGMDRATLDAAYDNSAAVADRADYLARWRAKSAEMRASSGAKLDVPYGARERARLDYFPSGAKQAPLFVFIHGGYWQRNEKETFAFVAEGPSPAASTSPWWGIRLRQKLGCPRSSGRSASR